MRAVEVQKRGALHMHVLLWSAEPLDGQVLDVQEMVTTAGFGCVFDLAPIEPGSRKHAYYLSKYVTKSVDQRGDVPWTADVVDRLTGEVRRMKTVASYRAWSSSRGWGLTMAEVRAECARAAQAAATRRAPLELAAADAPATELPAPTSTAEPPT